MLDRLRSRYRSYDWAPVTVGMSGARIWRLAGRRDLFVKLAPVSEHPDSGSDLIAEAARCQWLRDQGFPAPEVVESGSREAVAWLVTWALPGRSLAEMSVANSWLPVADSVADFVRALHALPVSSCPFVRDLSVTVPAAEEAVRLGLVDVEHLDDQRSGRTPQSLLAELERTRPAAEDLVVCHGDLCAPNVLVDPGSLEVSGVVDLGRLGVADRHQDLALMWRSLTDERNSHVPRIAARRLLLRYGHHADPGRMAFYTLLDEFF